MSVPIGTGAWNIFGMVWLQRIWVIQFTWLAPMRAGDLRRIDIFGKVEGHKVGPPQAFFLYFVHTHQCPVYLRNWKIGLK